jgi:hypothetical protein
MKKNTLIVGHSNTTPQLAHLLTHQKTEPSTEKDYQVLYQVHFHRGQVSLIKLVQPLHCNQNP